MKFNVNSVSKKFQQGLFEYKTELDIQFDETGVKVYALADKEFSVDFDGENLKIAYRYESEFYRAIAMVFANEEKPFQYNGKRFFDDFGVHTSTRTYAPNIPYIKKLIRKFALLGFNQFEFYMHSNFEIDGELYFGYKSGKFSQKELKEVADYGEMLGVEVIPCLETLAHQPELKFWKPYSSLYDWDDILNVGKEEVYVLIEKMIATCAKCFHSKKINLGMDEAYMLGHGQYFRENGLQPRIEIFLKHLSKVVSIAEKYGYAEQIIWSDMLYTTYNNYWYWGPNQIPQDVMERIPKSVTLAYWDYYGTDDDHYNWCMKNHIQTGHKVLFAGGVWNWSGRLTHNRFSMQILEMALGLCKSNGIDNVLITSWGFAPLLHLLPSLTYVSAFAYGENQEFLKRLFKVVAGCEFDDFMLLDTPNYIAHDQCYVSTVSDTTLYNDYFLGLYDCDVREGVSGIWLEHIKVLENAKSHVGEYAISFDKCIALCKICYLKYELGLKTRKAYREKDVNALSLLIQNAYTPLIELYENYLLIREKEWRTMYKFTAFEKEVAEIGAMVSRTKYCIRQLNAFINGEIDCIEELDADVLDINGGGKEFNHSSYPSMEYDFRKVFSLIFHFSC